MLIADLNYLEDILEVSSVSGSVGVGVSAVALATGDSTYTLTNTNATARMLPSGVSIAIGRTKAIAIGDDPMAEVSVFGEGDKVFGRTKVRYFPNRDMVVARGFVVAIDLP